MKQGRNDRQRIHLHVYNNIRHSQRMKNIRFSGFANLSVMGFVRKLVRFPNPIEIRFLYIGRRLFE
ncbi:hypothetical protein D3C74_241880 [compost metagenome]